MGEHVRGETDPTTAPTGDDTPRPHHLALEKIDQVLEAQFQDNRYLLALNKILILGCAASSAALDMRTGIDNSIPIRGISTQLYSAALLENIMSPEHRRENKVDAEVYSRLFADNHASEVHATNLPTITDSMVAMLTEGKVPIVSKSVIDFFAHLRSSSHTLFQEVADTWYLEGGHIDTDVIDQELAWRHTGLEVPTARSVRSRGLTRNREQLMLRRLTGNGRTRSVAREPAIKREDYGFLLDDVRGDYGDHTEEALKKRKQQLLERLDATGSRPNFQMWRQGEHLYLTEEIARQVGHGMLSLLNSIGHGKEHEIYASKRKLSSEAVQPADSELVDLH